MDQRKRRIKLSKLYSYACARPSVAEGQETAPVTGPGFSRIVYCNQPDLHKAKPFKYRTNYVSTTKYNVLTFFPKALFEQFRRVANLYFLFAAALSLTPLAPFTAASLIAPLVFVVGLSMAKEALEDWRRYQQDEEVNKRKVKVHAGGGKFESSEWQKLQVGDVVLVEKDDFFPADLLLLSSSYADGICYVETMNLDGETNLKLKRSPERTVELDEDAEFASFRGLIRCEDPNPDLYTFVGNLEYLEEVIPLGPQTILLRDSKLRNTQFIYGVVVFSGHDTKVMQNATEPPSKRSSIERKMDYIIYFLFCALLLIGAVGSIVFGLKTKYDMPNWWYLRPDNTTIFFNPRKSFSAALLHFVTALILYGYLIPISLYVSIEIVKVLQATFINQDLEMYHTETDTPARARTSNLNEELGQVDTILSDKTGTLTCNMMEFIKCSIAGTPYGKGVTEVEKAAAERLGKGSMDNDAASEYQNMHDQDSGIEMTTKPRLKGFNFEDKRIMEGNWIHEPNSEDIRMFLRILAICQTAIPEEDESTGVISYEAESPDEAAFVVAARELGFEFFTRTQSSVLLREFDPVSKTKVRREYKILNLLEFNSTRKRMSVIIKDESGQIFLFCKGADSVIFERLKSDGRKYEDSTTKHLAAYGDAGLRTLALAYRKLDKAEYVEWNTLFVKAKTTVGANREALLDAASEKIEKDLFLVGATAVEDKLQKGVPECIDHLAQAGLKIWVLTGDKMETAINIGFACSLLRQGMQQIIVSLENSGEAKTAESLQDKETLIKVSREIIAEQISNGQKQISNERSDDTAFALIIDGKALSFALQDGLKDKLLQLATNCASVICCRVSPKQKALVTELVRKGTGRTTLAIGDGANDVGMIQEADIGVGISGVEGMQAVMASDFAIAQFRFLERLLIVHGHWCYKRISRMICYFFYKNITFGLTLFYYEAYTSFSGQSAYNDWYLSLFNVVFSSLPVLALGVFEKDVPARVCLQFPTLYQQGPKNMFFNWPYIFTWMFNGLYSSAIAFFLAINIYQHQAFRKGGQTSGLEVLGATMYTCIVWTVNLQIALAISYFTWIQHVFIWGSIAVWYLFLVVYGYVRSDLSTTAYKVFVEALAPAPSYWIGVLVIVVACLLPYFVVTSLHRTFWPKDHNILQEMMHLEKHTKDPEMWSREGFKSVNKTSIGSSARAEAKIRQLKQHIGHD